jgi:hypothetical protein
LRDRAGFPKLFVPNGEGIGGAFGYALKRSIVIPGDVVPMRHQTFAVQGLLATFITVTGCAQSPSGALPNSVAVTSPGGGGATAALATPVVVAPAPVSPTAIPTSTPTPAPSASPAPAKLRIDFEDQAVGSFPIDFVDVASEAQVPSWVYQGNWKVSVDERGNHVLLHDDIREQPNVSFVRYRGSTLGKPDGLLPEVYFAQVDMRPIKSPNNYPPTGDQGVQFYYLGYNQYLEVVVKPDVLEIWECDGGEPKTTKGWHRLWNQALSTNAGDIRRIGALVDKRAATFTVYLDGQPQGTVQSGLLGVKPSWLTLRGIGNVVSFDNLVVEPR